MYYFRDSVLVYKSLNGTSPSCLHVAQKLHYRSHTRSLRSVGVDLLNKCNLDRIARPMETVFAVNAPKE